MEMLGENFHVTRLRCFDKDTVFCRPPSRRGSEVRSLNALFELFGDVAHDRSIFQADRLYRQAATNRLKMDTRCALEQTCDVCRAHTAAKIVAVVKTNIDYLHILHSTDDLHRTRLQKIQCAYVTTRAGTGRLCHSRGAATSQRRCVICLWYTVGKTGVSMGCV